jgi:hypothetical protein
MFVPCSLQKMMKKIHRQHIGQGVSLESRYAALLWRRQTFFALSPSAEMDSIASPPTPASADGPTPAIAGSLAPLFYAEDFIEGGRWWGGGALVGQ